MAKVGDFTTFVPTRFQTDAQTESVNSSNSVTSKTNGKTTDDSKFIDRVPVSTKGKPPETDANEWLFREALKQIAPKYGLNSSDIELEIKSRQNTLTDADPSNDHNFLQNPIPKNAQKYETTLGIRESTIQKMQERKQVLQIIAEKEAFGGKLSDADIFALSELGYSQQDIADLRSIKMMEYGGLQSNFEQRTKDQFQNLNNELRQKLVSEELDKLNQRPDSDFYVEGNEKINPDFERRRLANEIVNGKLAGRTPFDYLRDQKNEEALEKRLADKSFTDYLSNGSKNLLSSFYGGIGDSLKGIAVLANGIRRYDEDGNKLDTKASDALIYKAGEWVKQNVQAPNVDPDFDKTFTAGTFPKTVGSVLPYILGGWATGAPKATVAIMSGLSTGSVVYDEAKAKGATETQAQKTALLTGGFVGLTSTFGYGKTLEALNRGTGAATWKSIFSEAIKDGGRNAIVAGGQTIGENTIAKNTYDPNRGYLDNVRERMIAAGITGTALRGGLEIIAKVRAGRNLQTLAETQKTLRIKPESEVKINPEINPKVAELNSQANVAKANLNEKINSIEKIKTEKLATEKASVTIKKAKINEPVITQNLQSIAKETGGELVGLDKRFKTEESLARKFADRTQDKVNEAQKKGKNVDEIRNKAIEKEVGKNNDALRYTYTFSPEKYVDGYSQTVKTLEKQGYKLVQSDNYWLLKGTEKDKGYRGINTTFIAPNGQKFELQFHTPESFKFKNNYHYLYDEGRNPKTSQKRRDEIDQQNIRLAEPIVVPKDIDKIVNQRIQK